MEPQRIEDMFYKLVELYATIKADIKHVATQKYVIEKNLEHAADCPVAKKHRILYLVGSLIAGASFIGGVIFTSFL